MRGKGEGSIYKRKDGMWCATVELPAHGGTRRRKVITSKDKGVVIAKLTKLKGELERHGDLPTASQTVEQWFTYWLESLAVKEVRPKTIAGYRSVVNGHIIPAIGTVRLDKLTAAHIRRVEDRITSTPKSKDDPSKGFLSSTYALNAHRIMAASLAVAVMEGRMTRNPAKQSKPPKRAVSTLEALSLEEGIKVLDMVTQDPVLGARWATALLTGARRGEVLGLERDRVSDDSLDLSWQLQRLVWDHGCSGGCGRKRGTDCPERRLTIPADYECRHLTGGLYLTRPKSNAGWRVVPLVEPLRSFLQMQIEGTPPNKYGLVWAPGGKPIDPDEDSRAWQRVLESTGIDKNIRLHDLRHTAVDLMVMAGVPDQIIKEIVGHATVTMTQAYRSKAKRNRPALTEAMEKFSALFSAGGSELQA